MTTSTKLIVVGAASLLSMAMAAGGVLPGDGALSTATASGQVQQASGVASVPAHPVLARVRSIAAVQDRDRLAVQDRDRLAVQDQDRVAVQDRDRVAVPDQDRVAVPDQDRLAVQDQDRLAVQDQAVSYTHLRAHETDSYLVCRLLL